MTEHRNPPPLVGVGDPDRHSQQVDVGAGGRAWQPNGLGKKVIAGDRDPHLAGCGGADGQLVSAPGGGEFAGALLPIVDRLTGDHAQVDHVGVLADPD